MSILVLAVMCCGSNLNPNIPFDFHLVHYCHAISNGAQCFPCNLYIMVIGPPTTGKSPAMKECAVDPLILVQDNCGIGNFVIERCTSSALVKVLSEENKAMVLSPELYDVLNKMLKNDEENGLGEV